MKEVSKIRKIKPGLSVIIGALSFVLLTIFDQLMKKWAVLRLKDHDPIIIIKNVFQLYYLENHGAAFGILQGRRAAFILITVVVLAIVIYIYARLPFTVRYRFLRILIVFISAGAVGNFIDRLRQAYVVDFFYFNLINFPIFNVADIYVTVCVILLIIYLIFFVKEEMMDEIVASMFPWKKKDR